MSEPPPGSSPPPPPESSPPPPEVRPQYTVPAPATDQWLGPRAPYFGIGAGLGLYLLAYAIATVVTVSEPEEYTRQLTALASSVLAGGVVTLVVLVVAIVLISVRRTRAFGAGLAISMAVGVLCGGGVCTALLFATAGA